MIFCFSGGQATAMERRTHYDLLGVRPDAEDVVIRAAYRALMRKYHPDIDPDNLPMALAIGEAYRVLNSPLDRKAYDRSIAPAAREAPIQARDRAPTGGAAPSPSPSPPGAKRPAAAPLPRRQKAATIAQRRSWAVAAVGILLVTGSVAASSAFMSNDDLGNEYAEQVPGYLPPPGEITADTVDQQLAQSLSFLIDAGRPSSYRATTASDRGQRALAIRDADVTQAVRKYRQLARQNGYEAILAFSRKCSRAAARVNTLPSHDFCLAFDYAAGRHLGRPIGAAASDEPFSLMMPANATRGGSTSARVAVNVDPNGGRAARLRSMVEALDGKESRPPDS